VRKDKIGFGLIGLGLISMGHEWAYKQKDDRVEIVALCDIDEKKANRRARKIDANVYLDYRELLADPRVEAVDITLPHTLHYEVAKAALEAKKHVIIEKPITLVSAEALELIQIAQRQDVKFTVAENTRFVAAYIEAENIIKQGILGEPRLIRTFISGSEVIRLRQTDNWKGRKDGSGGGAIIDAGAHSIYLIKWLAGEIDEVQGYQYKWVEESQVEDNGVVGGRLKNGGLFSTEYSFIVEAPWSERLEFHGDKGSLIIDQIINPPAIYYLGGIDYKGTLLDVNYDPQMWKINSITDGVKDFVDAVWENRDPLVDPMDGYYAVKVIEKAYESIAIGKPLKV
jgi:predicted dehydrogenase